MGEHLVTTYKRRFVHRRLDGQQGTVCGTVPNPGRLVRVTEDEAFALHFCKSCFNRVPGTVAAMRARMM